MKKKLIHFFLLPLISASVATTGFAQTEWPGITETAKPWTRWWWMGSAVDEKNIALQLDTLAASGIGGVEIVPIYGAKGFENRYLKYLSPEWMKVLDFTVSRAKANGMGVDVAVGTGWPIGGPQVSPEDAAVKLIVQRYETTPGTVFNKKISVDDPKQVNVKGVSLATVYALTPDKRLTDLMPFVKDSVLTWTPTEPGTIIYAMFNGKTRQAVKRAAPGGEGFTLDHFSDKSLNNYFLRFDSVFGASARGIRAFFNDSYEVFGANWSPVFLSEFEKRRGYDLRRYIPELLSSEESALVARVKSDYRETMSDLMMENFSSRFSTWAHSKGALSTNQAHGSPGNLIDLYAAVDIAESETFGPAKFEIPGLRRDPDAIQHVDPDPIMLKFASSAAHLTGHRYASTETFTWLTEHFKTAWGQCKPEVEQVFLSGINHVFYHGTTYSPADAPWPGWLFYASVNFVPANSLWPHLRALNQYIARCQSVLQAGSPDNEIMMYWPVYDAWHSSRGMDMPFRVHDLNKWLYPSSFYKNAGMLQQAGYSFDFVSDRMLANAFVKNGRIAVSDSGSLHKTLVIPACAMMPNETIASIIALAQKGATVIWEKLPDDVPGLNNLEARRAEQKRLLSSLSFGDDNSGIREAKIGNGRIILSSDLQAGLVYAGIRAESLTDTGLKFIRRKHGNDTYYYLVNHTSAAIDRDILFNSRGESVVLLDPQTGREGVIETTRKGEQTFVHIKMEPGEALFVKFCAGRSSVPSWKYYIPSGNATVIKGPWSVTFTSGGPTIPPSVKMDQLESWTTLPDSSYRSFSGTAEYTATFRLNGKPAGEYLLKLGTVCESARVWINGKELGFVWSLPNQRLIGSLLKPGQNTIRVEVANLMANRIAYMDRNKMVWRNYHEINFVNVKYKAFDASNWEPVPSGLLGPVEIIPLRADAVRK